MRLILILALATAASAETIHTNPDRITPDLAKLKPGDELVLASGVYIGPLTLRNQQGGEQGCPTVIRSAVPHEALIVGVDGDALRIGTEARYPNGCHWVIVDGVRCAYSMRDGIRGYGSNCIVRNCRLDHNGVAKPPPASGPTGQGLAWFGDHRSCMFEGNLIEHNGSNAWDHGAYLYGYNHVLRSNVVRWNTGYGIQGYSWTTGFVLDRNIVYQNGTGGIYLRSRPGEPPVVTHNVLIDNATYGLILIDGDQMPRVSDNIGLLNRRGVVATGGTCPLRGAESMPAREEHDAD